MKPLTRIALPLLTVLLCASAARAQNAPASVTFAPEGEEFSAQFPRPPESQPELVRAGGIRFLGSRYTAADENGSFYGLWSLRDTDNVGARLAKESYVSHYFGGEALFLDRVAELAWNLLVKDEFERVKQAGGDDEFPSLTYSTEFELDGRPARLYLLKLRNAGGLVRVATDGPRVYVVAAFGLPAYSADAKRFVASFRLKTKAADPAAPGSAGTTPVVDPAVGGVPVDYSLAFKQTEVTQKAVITFKPEPGFTEEARKFGVTGVVRIRAILDKTGEVTVYSVLKGLPHGLTTQALAAVRRVKFEPAQKDGRAVSQYVIFEYNFNIY